MRSIPAFLALAMIVATLGGMSSAAPAKATVKEERPGLLARARVSTESAEAIAQSKVPHAKRVSAEIEEESGKLIYSFEFKTAGKAGVDEVNIDASTGTVLGVEHEGPRQRNGGAEKRR